MCGDVAEGVEEQDPPIEEINDYYTGGGIEHGDDQWEGDTGANERNGITKDTRSNLHPRGEMPQ